MHLVRVTGDHSGGLGFFTQMATLIGIACVVFIPIAIVAKYKNKDMSKRFYKINCILFSYITIATIIVIHV
jgi:hypothetical protein